MPDKGEKPPKAAPGGKPGKQGKPDKPRGDKPGKSAKPGRADKADKADKAEEQEAAVQAEAKPTRPPRLHERYQKEFIQALMKEFDYGNLMQVPRLEKIVVNMGMGEAISNGKLIDAAVQDVSAITGQKPVITRAKKAIANFKLRQGVPIGVMVTLRQNRMYEFLDRLVNIALPRVRDFKGVSGKSFDGRGNYTLGLREQLIFPEINYDKVEKVKGMNITIVTTARTDEEAKALLRLFGMPFRN
jgi:large subunit ribosomal protein L5